MEINVFCGREYNIIAFIINYWYNNEEFFCFVNQKGVFMIFTNKISVKNLKINLLGTNIAICTDDEPLVFSWKIDSVIDGTMQSAYRIIISDSFSSIHDEKATLWDSGIVKSHKSAGVECPFRDFPTNKPCYVRVKVFCQDYESEFSKPSMFYCFSNCGKIFNHAIWSKNDSDMIFIRKDFSVAQKEIELACIACYASSYKAAKQYVCDIKINGKTVGFAPRNPHGDTEFFTTINITKEIKSGDNALGVVAFTKLEKLFSAKIYIHYADGTSEIIESDETWKTLDATDIFRVNENIGTHYYFAPAENLDLRKYPHGFSECNFDDSAWHKSHVKQLALVNIEPAPSESMRRYKADIKSITKLGLNRYLIDLGKEIIGGVTFNLSGDKTRKLKNKRITLRYGEELKENGRVMHHLRCGNVYEEKIILTDKECTVQNWGFKAFRYIEVSSLTDINLVTSNFIVPFSLRMKDDYPLCSFDSSKSSLKKMYEFSKYSILMTSQELYVDSQTRERGNYEGDAYINQLSQYALSNSYSLARFSIRDLFYNETWPLEYKQIIIFSAYLDYMYTGDLTLLKKWYPVLKTKTALENGDINNGFDEEINLIYSDYSNDRVVNRNLVDWPPSERDGYLIEKAYYNTVVNAVHYKAFLYLSKIAEILGEKKDKEYYYSISEKIKTSMLENLVSKNTLLFCDGLDKYKMLLQHTAEHACIYPLAMGVVDNYDIAENLTDYILQKGIKTSIYGAQFLFDALYNSERGDIASLLYERKNTHSFYHIIKVLGCTLSPEAWDPKLKPNMTFSHPWGASPANIFVRGLFGIKPLEPGFSKMKIKIQPGNIEYAKIKTPTVKGVISCKFFKSDDGTYTYNISIPANSVAEVYLPDSNGIFEKQYINGNGTNVFKR